MQNKFIYIANWKMYFTFNQEIQWLNQNLNELEKIANQSNQIVICPSYVSLSSFNNILKKNSIKLGAQNCSNFEIGPYTGEISVESLSELNCQYCIVGHSDSRQYFNETNEAVAKKASMLLTKKIIPIICIGETKTEYENGQIENIIQSQLCYLIDFFHRLNLEKNEIIIAYEPVWSIGTGIIPSNEYIKEVSNFIKQQMNKSNIPYKLLYGGSVREETVLDLKKNEFINGFLIGKASTDFQELKKIVLL